jgi:hypothetical protein
VEGRVYRDASKERREFTIEGENQIVIVRLDLKRVWSLIPDEKIYIETSFDEALGKPKAHAAGGEGKITITPLGREPFGTVTANKEHVTGQDVDGRPIDGTIWVSDEGIMLRVETVLQDDQGGKHQVRMELHDVKTGPQDAKLFQIPADYRPAGQTRTGGNPPRGAQPTPADTE